MLTPRWSIHPIFLVLWFALFSALSPVALAEYVEIPDVEEFRATPTEAELAQVRLFSTLLSVTAHTRVAEAVAGLYAHQSGGAVHLIELDLPVLDILEPRAYGAPQMPHYPKSWWDAHAGGLPVTGEGGAVLEHFPLNGDLESLVPLKIDAAEIKSARAGGNTPLSLRWP